MARKTDEVLKVKKDGKCPACGGVLFMAPYTERAWQKFNGLKDGKLVAQQDGYNVEEHYVEKAAAECEGCDAKVDLSDLEIV